MLGEDWQKRKEEEEEEEDADADDDDEAEWTEKAHVRTAVFLVISEAGEERRNAAVAVPLDTLHAVYSCRVYSWMRYFFQVNTCAHPAVSAPSSSAVHALRSLHTLNVPHPLTPYR